MVHVFSSRFWQWPSPWRRGSGSLMERKELMLNSPQDSQPWQENKAERPHGGMVYILPCFSLCLSSFSINKKKTANWYHQTLVWLQCDFYCLVYYPEGHNGTEMLLMLVIITCHAVDSSVKPQELEICFHPLNTLLLHYLITSPITSPWQQETL